MKFGNPNKPAPELWQIMKRYAHDFVAAEEWVAVAESHDALRIELETHIKRVQQE